MHYPAKLALTLGLSALFGGLALSQPPTTQPDPVVRPGVAGQAGQQPGLPSSISSPLFQNPDVRRDLGLTEKQFGQMNDSFSRLRTRFQDHFGRLGTLDEKARAARLQELQQNFNTEFARSAQELLTREQATRLRQLELQRRGFDAFTDAEVQRQLNLNDEQRRRLQALGVEVGQREAEILRGIETNRDRSLQQFDNLRRQTLDRTNAIFNEQQRRAWNQMTGNPFIFRPSLPPPGQRLPPR